MVTAAAAVSSQLSMIANIPNTSSMNPAILMLPIRKPVRPHPAAMPTIAPIGIISVAVQAFPRLPPLNKKFMITAQWLPLFIAILICKLIPVAASPGMLPVPATMPLPFVVGMTTSVVPALAPGKLKTPGAPVGVCPVLSGSNMAARRSVMLLATPCTKN
jgi:hypothetical protein